LYAAILLSVSVAPTAWAQWSADPSVNLPLADKVDGNDQVQPKVKPLPGGGWYVSWTSDSNVVVQRLDGNGKPKWGAGVVFSESEYQYSLADLHASDNGSVKQELTYVP